MLLRRCVFATLVAAIFIGLNALLWHVLAAGGWTLPEGLIAGCFLPNSAWLSLIAATALLGLAVRRFAPDVEASVLPAAAQIGSAGAVTERVALVLCVRLENPDLTLPPLAGLLRVLRAGQDGERFTAAILSDTPDGQEASSEAEAIARVFAGFPDGAVLYRRRSANTGYKAGNVMDFFDGPGAAFAFALLLDADSAMSPALVRRLVMIMQADPRLAILQTSVEGHQTETRFANQLAFGQRHSARVWMVGQAWWQGGEGPFWGHNALLRIAAFRAHCRLPVLAGGAHILSHDHVEAALLHAAGCQVRVIPNDTGSYEVPPPDLPAMLARDRRWAAGNLQYLRLIRWCRLGRVGRLQMLQAAMHYLLAPFWLAILPLALWNIAVGGGATTSDDILAGLLLAVFACINMPKFAGFASGPRGRLRPADMVAEALFGLLLAPITAVNAAVTVMRLAVSRDLGWMPQRRNSLDVGWPQAARQFGFHTALGCVLLAGFALDGVRPALLALPALLGLLLAIPFCVLTSRPRSPRRRGAVPALRGPEVSATGSLIQPSAPAAPRA